MMNNVYISQRYLCDVLEDMRKADKTKNYSYTAGLIEEAQILATAMEEALELKQSRLELTKKMKKYRRIAKKLNKYIEELDELNEEFKESKKKPRKK